MGTGCPECATIAIAVARFTPALGRSLPRIAPEVAAQWYLEKNGNLRPEQVVTALNTQRWSWCAQHRG